MRGQTLPAWLGNIILTLIFAIFLGTYGNVIAYQFRVQSAADSVADAAVAIQAMQFNQMLEGLYAAGVEEYRLRHILESIRVTASHSGGCNVDSNGKDCEQIWPGLIQAYRQSLYRYDQDVKVVNRITYSMTPQAAQQDALLFISQVNAACANNTNSALAYSMNCNGALKNMTFSADEVTFRTANLKNVLADSMNNLLPSYHDTGVLTNPAPMFEPIAVQVSVCAVVPPLFPALQKIGAPTIVMARSAATNAMLEEDWLEPGDDPNPLTGDYFQPEEFFGDAEVGGANNWYSVNFGGNPAHTSYTNGSPGTSSIVSQVYGEEFSARTGWWGPMQILPFEKTSSLKANASGTGCAANG